MQLGKRTTFIFYCLLISSLLTSCTIVNQGNNPSTTTSAPANKQILVKPIVGLQDIATLDPARVNDQPSASIVNMLYTGLIELDDSGAIQKVLAQSYKVGADGLTWTFTLRDHLQFNDGTPLTSADVAYSIDRALQPATKSPSAGYYLKLIKDSDRLSSGQIKTLIGDSILTPDSRTVIIITSRQAAYFLYTLTYQTAYVVEKKLVTTYGSQFTEHLDQNGASGPWQLAHYLPGKEIVFVPNAHYFGAKPQLKKIVRPFYPSPNTAYQNYQIDRLDAAPIPRAHIAEIKKSLPDQYHQYPLLATSYFAMNYLVKPFDNIKVRQAFALALNKDLIATRVYPATTIATNHIIPVGIPGYNPNLSGPAGIKNTAGDPILAKKLFEEGLREEGLNQAPPITLSIPASISVDTRSQDVVFQQMWQQALGINVIINYVDFNKLQNDVATAINNPHGLMFWYSSWIADYPDAQDWTSLQFSKGSEQNAINYGQNRSTTAIQQQATQQLLTQADASLKPEERTQLYKKAEQQLVDDVAWLPVTQQIAVYVQKPCVKGIAESTYGITPPDDWSHIFISTITPCVTNP